MFKRRKTPFSGKKQISRMWKKVNTLISSFVLSLSLFNVLVLTFVLTLTLTLTISTAHLPYPLSMIHDPNDYPRSSRTSSTVTVHEFHLRVSNANSYSSNASGETSSLPVYVSLLFHQKEKGDGRMERKRRTRMGRGFLEDSPAIMIENIQLHGLVNVKAVEFGVTH